MYVAQIWTRSIAVMAIVIAAAVSWPHAAAARGHHRDPMQTLERQHHRSDVVRMNHRKEMDLRGAEIRDAKKSAQDSRQNQMQTELGPVNEQSDRFVSPY
jgi:hypothetical protein